MNVINTAATEQHLPLYDSGLTPDPAVPCPFRVSTRRSAPRFGPTSDSPQSLVLPPTPPAVAIIRQSVRPAQASSLRGRFESVT